MRELDGGKTPLTRRRPDRHHKTLGGKRAALLLVCCLFAALPLAIGRVSAPRVHAAPSAPTGFTPAISATPVTAAASPTVTGASPVASSTADPSDPDGVIVADSFESGPLADWSRTTNAKIVVSAGGNHILHVTEDSGATGPVLNLPKPAPDVYAYLRLRLPIGEQSNIGLLTVLGNAGNSVATVRVNEHGMLEVDGASPNDKLVSRTPVTPGLWHDIQVHLTTGAAGAHIEVWYDGAYLNLLHGDLRANASNVGSIAVGSYPDSSATLDVDNVIISSRSIDGSTIAQVAPVVTPTVVPPTATAAATAVVRSTSTASPVAAAGRVEGGNGAVEPTPPSSNSPLDILRGVIAPLVLLLSLFLTAQGFFTLALMLYTWARAERLIVSGSPSTFAEPTLRFTALLPARHEREVIAQTVRRVWSANYPKDRLEVVVVCEHKDTETIAEAERAASEIGHPNVRVVTFSDGPINKPHGLNVAFRDTTHEVVTIFDAEDDVHPDIFNVANTVMQRDGAGIVQAGVQLMDFQSTWFAVHNVLEYFFWFKSRLHFHAQIGMVPLGGNTVFMRRRLIEMVGGWDEQCLTEDADIGIRLSTLGERITITYDAEHATREETPPNLTQFVKQRTRWNQGFLQVLRKRIWKRFPNRTQRLLAAYTLTYPFTQSLFGLLWAPALIATFLLKLNVAVAMVSLLPLYALIFQFVASLLGLFDFARAYHLRIRPRDLFIFTVSFLPYQMLLSFGALRAVYRERRGRTNWEKTAHTGAHRAPAGARPLKGDAR